MATFAIEHPGPRWQFQVEADAGAARIAHLGWDTECTNRHAINLLADPAEITFARGGEEIRPAISNALARSGLIEYTFVVAGKEHMTCRLTMEPGTYALTLSCIVDGEPDVSEMVLYVPFDPRVAVVSVITNTWDGAGQFEPPFVLSAPDIGQVLVTGHPGSRIKCDLEGNRRWACLDLIVRVPVRGQGVPAALEFAPVVLPQPAGFTDEPAWKAARRGWFNMMQFSCGASGGGAPAKGVWANNTLSDPVSSLLYMLGDATLLVPELCPGVSMLPLLRRAIDYWIDCKTGADGLVAYTAGGRDQNVMDGNPAVLIAAWCYVEASRDVEWLTGRIDALERIARYMEGRDVDGDGILESKQSGNWGSQATRDPDCAWDCYVSGHKNAYVNALAYRAWNCMAALERRLGRTDMAGHYKRSAERLKLSYLPAFHDPETGWLGFWRSRDGHLHEIHNDSPTSMAISYGLVDTAEGKAMLQKYWAALERIGFRRFDLGVPLNLVPVPPAEMSAYFEFQQFLNGGCCVSNSSWLIDGLYRVGMTEQADTILNAMLARQRDGAFPNGGGFQNGFVDKMGLGAEVFDWDGRPAGYEGHLVYCWGFLQSLLLKVPSIRGRVHPF
ncbi:MAG: hypothetical protein JW839_14795 [Candidatus Lokiarchaeota archaeon]|nr:hypothetical protein [Candidatus Lokiarchaeota archaeon]